METSDSVFAIFDKEKAYFKRAGQYVRALVEGSTSPSGAMFPRGCAYAKVGSHVYIFGGVSKSSYLSTILDFDSSPPHFAWIHLCRLDGHSCVHLWGMERLCILQRHHRLRHSDGSSAGTGMQLVSGTGIVCFAKTVGVLKGNA